MKTAAAYLRVSDERQDEFSPDSQLKLIKDYCVRNEIELPEELIFYDDGISAKSVKKRKQFNEMIALAKLKEKPFSMILVWKFSRFARNQEESIVYKAMLRKNGVDVVSVSEPLQDNPFGGLIERIIEWMDEYYLIRLSDEVRRGMTERATRGLPNSAPPFGYHMQDGRYVVDEAEAAVVRQMFEMYVSGVGVRKIADHFRVLGVKNHYGNPIDNRGVDYILNNPCYIGYVRWNPHGRSSSKRNFNNPEDILKKAEHTPVVSDEIFEKAQAVTAERKKIHQKYAREDLGTNAFMLKGLVRCDTCGATLVLQKASNGLQCHKYAHGSCGVSHHINLNIINQMVIDELKNAVKTLSFDIDVKPEKPVSVPSVDYDALISAEKLKLERAKQAYQEGVDSLAEYKTSKAKIESNIKKIEREKQSAVAKSADVNLKAFADTVGEVIELIESPDVSEELKNQALRTIVKEIIFFKPDKRIEIHFYI